MSEHVERNALSERVTALFAELMHAFIGKHPQDRDEQQCHTVSCIASGHGPVDHSLSAGAPIDPRPAHVVTQEILSLLERLDSRDGLSNVEASERAYPDDARRRLRELWTQQLHVEISAREPTVRPPYHVLRQRIEFATEHCGVQLPDLPGWTPSTGLRGLLLSLWMVEFDLQE